MSYYAHLATLKTINDIQPNDVVYRPEDPGFENLLKILSLSDESLLEDKNGKYVAFYIDRDAGSAAFFGNWRGSPEAMIGHADHMIMAKDAAKHFDYIKFDDDWPVLIAEEYHEERKNSVNILIAL